jgi:hypothetical protein
MFGSPLAALGLIFATMAGVVIAELALVSQA